MVEPLGMNFNVFTVKLVGLQKFRNLTVLLSQIIDQLIF